MKKASLFLILLLPLTLVGCLDTPPDAYKADGSTYRTVKIGNCDYVKSVYGSELTHKGDCSNPIHLYNRVNTTVVPPVITR